MTHCERPVQSSSMLGAPCQLRLLAGQEHGRTVYLSTSENAHSDRGEYQAGRKKMRSPASHNSRRRTFLLASSRTMVGALAACSGAMSQLFAKDQATSTQWLEQHLADLVATYGALGDHRTATPADDKSAQWLAEQVRQAGCEASFEPFALNRIDPPACVCASRAAASKACRCLTRHSWRRRHSRHHRSARQRRCIALVESEPFTLIESRKELGGPLAEARKSQHKGVVVLTRAVDPGFISLMRRL